MFGPSSHSTDDDIYEGYGTTTQSSIPITSSGRALGVGTRAGVFSNRGAPMTRQRLATGRLGGVGVPTTARPMTSARAAGFSRAGKSTTGNGSAFDPLNQATKKSNEPPPEEQIKTMETKIQGLLQESIAAERGGDVHAALEKAKEAMKKEKQVIKIREQNKLSDHTNLDLTYCVLFNLGNQYQNNKMYQEAMNTFSAIVKNKTFNQAGRLRVNMGNIYYTQKMFPQAIKFYRMALDQVPASHREMRLKIMANIGASFVKMGQFQDAVTSYQSIMEARPDHETAYNLLLCYFALGDKERMKKSFLKMVSFGLPSVEQNEDYGSSTQDDTIDDHEVFHEDSLRQLSRHMKKEAERLILLAARLIAPVVEDTFQEGFNWVVESIRSSQVPEIASELEIAKAIHYLKARDTKNAVETLKAIEKKDTKCVGSAATNLSSLYFMENDIKQAEKYAEAAIKVDRYNSKALVNKGNCFYAKENYEKAKEIYSEAVSIDASCLEAIYNLGLVHKQLNQYPDALNYFQKLNSILKNSSDVIYQLADICMKMNNFEQSLEWYNVLISVVPTDPGILAKMGELFVRQNDKSQAYQYYSESFRYFPSNLEVLSWIGAYYVECEIYEQAIQYFEKAVVIEPNEIKWHLMVASCYRRSGNYQQALEVAKKAHEQFPENVECLKFLVRVCTDLGLKDVHDYHTKLGRLEKYDAPKENSGPDGLLLGGVGKSKDETGGNNKADKGSGHANLHAAAAAAKAAGASGRPAGDVDIGGLEDDVAALLPE